MRVLICGDRNWTDVRRIGNFLIELTRANTPQYRGHDITIIHGAARGADTIAGVLAEWMGLKVEAYPADWEQYKRAAGPIRNQQMLASGIDLCIAFHNYIENSKGTADMVHRCTLAGVETRVLTSL